MMNYIDQRQNSVLPVVHRTLPLILLTAACVETPPQDVLGYPSCLKFNVDLLEPTGDSDPHLGYKSVYGCNVEEAALVDGPVKGYPDGTLIVKTSTRDDQDFVWLLASMRKTNGRWDWAEYTRNFADEEFARIPIDDSVCTDCHSQVEPIDWVFTVYRGTSPTNAE